MMIVLNVVIVKGFCVLCLYLIIKIQTMQIKFDVCRKTQFSSPTLYTWGSVTQDCFMHILLWAPFDRALLNVMNILNLIILQYADVFISWNEFQIPCRTGSLWFWAIVHTFIRFSTKYLIRPNISRTAWPSTLTWRFGKNVKIHKNPFEASDSAKASAS